jgi:hypothetical protein
MQQSVVDCMANESYIWLDAAVQQWRPSMRTHIKQKQDSPLDVFTELAIEGTSSLVEAQRTLLNLAQQENEILFHGVKDRIGGFLPGVAMTDMVRRSVETLIGMQQELLTTASRQTLHWIESEKAGKNDRSGRLVQLAQEAVETFMRAQHKFLDVVAQESAKATSGKHAHEDKPVHKTELAVLAREAANAFIEAQKRLLDVMGQQMNVNLDVSTRSMKMMSPSQLMPVANLTEEGVRNFFNTETNLIGSLINPRKPKAASRAKPGRNRAKQHKPVAV